MSHRHGEKHHEQKAAAVQKDGPVSIGGQSRPMGTDSSFTFDVTADLFVKPAGITQPNYRDNWLFIGAYHAVNYPEGSPQRVFIEKNCFHADSALNSPDWISYTSSGVVKEVNGSLDVGYPTIDAFVKDGKQYGVKAIATRFSGDEATMVAYINSLTDSSGPSGSGFSPFE